MYLLLVTWCLIIPSYETNYDDSTIITSLVSSLPTLNKSNGETKVSKRSPLIHGYVIGIEDAQPALTSISHNANTVPYLLSSEVAHSPPSDLAHVTKSQLSHTAHGLTVRGHAFQHVTHALVPTIIDLTTSTFSGHGFAKSPTLTVLEHSLFPVAALNTKPSHGLSKQSTVTLTPVSLSKPMFAVHHDQRDHNHILTTFTEHAKDGLLLRSPATHTIVQKVPTLSHDHEPVLTHDVSGTHITDSAIPTHNLPHQNVFRTHYGGFGVGIDFGGHGSGHGFYV